MKSCFNFDELLIGSFIFEENIIRYMRVAVIGGGAAGFFAAISCKSNYKHADVVILEKTKNTLSKVKVSGGGRCNVTNACVSQADFLKNYPRGARYLKKTFNKHNRKSTIQWFEDRGVLLKTEADGRMFPETNDSQTIIDCLRKEVETLDITLNSSRKIERIEISEIGFYLTIEGHKEYYDKVIVATGGSPKLDGFKWLCSLGHTIVSPVPSLFTFNIPAEKKLKELMGLSVDQVSLRISNTKLTQSGPVLVTHWGFSGPAILKLSAWGARLLNGNDYQFTTQVSWLGETNEEAIRSELNKNSFSKKKLINLNPFVVPTRLWSYLLDRIDLDSEKMWIDLSKKEKNKLVNVLVNDQYQVKGKTTFKEEFVTCGGVDNSEVDFNTMQSKKVPGLYFAGEVLDVDGITGGFNFQAAWSTGYVAGLLK